MNDLRSLIGAMHRARDIEKRYGGARIRSTPHGPIPDFTTADDPALRWLEYYAAQAENLSDAHAGARKLQWQQGLNRYKEKPFRELPSEATRGRPGSGPEAPNPAPGHGSGEDDPPAEARPQADQTHPVQVTKRPRYLR